MEDRTSSEIMKIRNRAREKLGIGPVDSCPTCTHSAYSPFRVYDKNGKVVEGCIDAFHSGHLTQISESNRWHNDPKSKKMRKEVLDNLKSHRGRSK